MVAALAGAVVRVRSMAGPGAARPEGGLMSGLWVLVICITVLLVGTTGARVVVYEVRQARNARHVLHGSGQTPDNQPDNFYGSMILDDERGLYRPAHAWIAPPDRCGLYPAESRCEACPYWPACQEADAGHWNDPDARPLDWRERTMAELAPEALDDPGPECPRCANLDGTMTESCYCREELDPGPGVASSPDPPPGPVFPFPELAPDHDPPPPMEFDGPWGPASLVPVHERLAGIGDIHEAHQSHPHPEDGWLDAQLADLYDWVRAQLEAAA